jgi:dihydrofolate reductase
MTAMTPERTFWEFATRCDEQRRHAMRRLVAWNMMTLDGYFEGRNPWDLGFHETVWGDELKAFSLEQGKEIGTLLFGRRTYEAWPATGQRRPGRWPT